MPDIWMPGAAIHDIGDHAPTDGGPAKAIAHITWDKNATAANPADWVSFESLVSYFTGSGAGAAPHIIWDPFTGRIAQLVPANSRSKSVVDVAGGTRTNRAGSVVIQVEAVFFPYCRRNGVVYPRLVDTPCAGWAELNAWIRSWGVPDEWPMGRPVDFTSRRNEATWETRAGWYGHSQVPENDHQDPGSWPSFGGGSAPAPTPAPATKTVTVKAGQTLGAIAVAAGVALSVILGLNPEVAKHPDVIPPGDTITVPAVPGTTPAPAPTTPAPSTPTPAPAPSGTGFPGASSFGPGASNASVTKLGQLLVSRGAGRFYAVGPGPIWGDADRRATAAFQAAQGWTGADADGIPGAETWRLLVTGQGKSIPAASTSAPAATPFPGNVYFHAGASNKYVTQLGQALVRKGFGTYYKQGPGPTWTEADRRAVAAFQRSKGWTGDAADGYPGLLTWKLAVG
ncbi:peptidoglycan-binding protein [Streptomyces sp. CB03911]|uniref:peptidoglycan-binding protein n=1 Tax=Streptomyces sp. CB03911 TaxID=1804758 RepID=UPI0009A0A812|nr:peptidoglycan-binding protein [Streptomyces sp. CB03911]